MPYDDQYVQEAKDAMRFAERSANDDARAGWLRIAKLWLGLVRGSPPDNEAFDRLTESVGTNQETSKSSH